MSARIAVVDDNPSSRYATARVLRGAGFQTVEFATGTSALEGIDTAVDMVVLDVNMPDLDGFEVCRRLRSAPDTQRIPIVHLSATFVDDVDRVQGLDAGADGYLISPTEPTVLIATINALLRARNAEEKRTVADARLRALFEAAPIGIAILSPDLRYEEANPAFCALVGQARDEVIGRPGNSFIAPGHDDALALAQAQVHAYGSWQGVLPLQRADDKVLEVDWNVVREVIGGQRILMATDITERLILQRERESLLESERVARQEAEFATRAKDEFLATLSHELRNPLSAIFNAVALLRHAPERLAHAIDTIQRAASLQKQLISDLLDISGIVSGRLQLDLEPIDLAEVIAAAADVVSPAAAAKGVTFSVATEPDLPKVSGDPHRLQQVIWNLLSNAVKFTPAGGRVSLATGQVDGRVEIAVSDTGKGIPQKFLPFVFEKFRQADAGPSRRAGGLGLGLTIVKHFVEMHGGQVFAISEGEDRGSTFTIRLPVGTPGPDAGPIEVDRLAGLRVLLVDDDEDSRAFVRRLLVDAGMTTDEAGNADDGLQKLETFSPDVLISDIGMPDKDGYVFIREVRALGFTSTKLPAIALTALSMATDRATALKAGYQAYLIKPVTPAKLLNTVAGLAPHRASQSHR